MIPSQVAGKLLRSGAASGGNNGDNGNGEDLNVLEPVSYTHLTLPTT